MFFLYLVYAFLAFGSILTLALGLRLRQQYFSTKGMTSTKIARIHKAGEYQAEGIISCDNPLRIGDWDTGVVWYDIWVMEYLRNSSSVGPGGSWGMAGSKSESCPFKIKDESGQITVLPGDDGISGEFKTYIYGKIPPYIQKFYPECKEEGRKVIFNYLPVNSNCFVQGTVDYSASELAFQKGEKQLKISGKTKTEFVDEAEKNYKKLLETSVTFALVGVGIYLYFEYIF
jgi:hypothetical protein